MALIGAYASRPKPGTSGQQYVGLTGETYIVDPPGSAVAYYYDGYHWRPSIDGVLGTEVAPCNSMTAYTQRNFASGTTATAVGGCVDLRVVNVGTNNHQLQGLDVAYTAGQTLTICVKPNHFPSAVLYIFGAYLYSSSMGCADSVAVDFNNSGSTTWGPLGGRIDAITWPNGSPPSATFSASSGIGAGERIWFRMSQDPTSGVVSSFISLDGVDFSNQISAVSSSVMFDRAGVFGDCFSANGTGPLAITVESFNVA
jgi:hypothetical protein